MDSGTQDLTLIMEADSMVEVVDSGIQGLTLIMEADSMVEVVGSGIQDLTLIMEADSMVVAITEMRASILETIMIIMGNGILEKMTDIILDIGMARKAMDIILGMKGQTWVSSLVLLLDWFDCGGAHSNHWLQEKVQICSYQWNVACLMFMK